MTRTLKIMLIKEIPVIFNADIAIKSVSEFCIEHGFEIEYSFIGGQKFGES